MLNRLRALYKDEPRWVNWKLQDGKKLPINAKSGGFARSDDPKTWVTYDKAKRQSDKIGIMLGHVPKYGDGWYLCGIDLDGCLNGQTLRPEAREIVERFKSYTEVSPSGKGVHIIFVAKASDVERIRKEFSIEHRKSFNIGQHEEIALDLSNRYYTVTEEAFNKYDLMDAVKLGDLEWFVRDAGPAFQRTFAKSGGKSDYTRDTSRSGFAFRHFKKQIDFGGKTEDDIINETKARRDPAGEWVREKLAAGNMREIHRVYANALRASEEKRQGANGQEADYLTSQLASEIEVKPIRWMWPNYFAYGKMGMIVGEPDQGKSTVSLDLASRVSRGAQWPDKSGRAPRGDVLMLNAEDDSSDTVVPRLMAAGADLKRVRILKMRSGKMFSLAENLKMLEDHITPSTRLVVIDPISTYLGVGVDAFRNNEVRGVLSPVVVLGEKYGILILILHHNNKGGGGKAQKNPMHRISDSIAFSAICRHIYTCAKAPEDVGGYGFMKVRNSVAAEHHGGNRGYSLQSVNLGNGIVTSRVVWDHEPPTWTLDDVQNSTQKGGSVMNDAVEFLKTELEKTPLACAKVVEKAELRNISRRTVYRAADSLNINKFNVEGAVMWSLPVP